MLIAMPLFVVTSTLFALCSTYTTLMVSRVLQVSVCFVELGIPSGRGRRGHQHLGLLDNRGLVQC